MKWSLIEASKQWYVLDKSVKAVKHFSGIYSWNNKNHHPKYMTFARPVRNLSYVSEQVWLKSEWKCRRASGVWEDSCESERSNGKQCTNTYTHTSHTQTSMETYTTQSWESWELLGGIFGINPRGKLYPPVWFVQGNRIFYTFFMKQNKELHYFHHYLMSSCPFSSRL